MEYFIESNDFAYIRRAYMVNTDALEFQGHSHLYHELYILIKGKTRFIIEGSDFNLNPYDILIIPPYKLHRALPKEDTYFDRIVIKIFPSMYKGMYCDEIINLFEEQSNVNRKIPGHIVKRSEIPQILDYIQTHANDNNPYVLSAIRSKITELLYKLHSNYQFEILSEPDGITQRVIDYIDRNLSNALTVQSISEHFNYSGRQLNAVFKKDTGITVSKYVDLKKMQKVIDLHQNGHSLIHSCIEAGFNSYDAFAYLYKKEYGSSPKNSFK